VAAKETIIDLSQIDLDHVVADLDEIRRYNRHRHEMEQLTAVVYEDTELHRCIGYKDLSRDEFWVRGHMPDMPVMPGVIMCEAAAQLSSYYALKHDLLDTKVVGFGGLEEVRFREPVIPGDRLYLLVALIKARKRRMMVCRFQGVVRGSVVVEGIIKGVPLPIDELVNTTT